MLLIVKKSELSGIAAIPGSKSHTIRAVVIGSLANGKSLIRSPLISSDTLSAVSAYRQFGAEIDTSNPRLWTIDGLNGCIDRKNIRIDTGNSGTTMNLAIGTAALSSSDSEIHLTGDSQIQYRPVGMLLKAINELGANARSIKENECPPVVISGRLQGGSTSIECQTSQYLSSLLLACPLASGDTELHVPLLYEPDYARMTLDWLRKQGIQCQASKKMDHFRIAGGQSYQPFDRAIPADFSSATFFLCAAALVGRDVTIQGLDFNDRQPDKAVVDYLKAMGAKITETAAGIRVRKSPLRGIDIDMNRTPDALPAMAVTAAFAKGPTRLLNVPQARKKETDRIACMAAELKKLGADVEELTDGLVVHGHEGRDLRPTVVHGWHDHRIVMALSLAGMALDGTLDIETAEAMDVTFPEYTNLMMQLGADFFLTKS
ncbi:MAG: 3-phosphoshikimate 1-carboxyvinyltransferase [Planctomycetaceae bacterium]|nr:3-phosphoshikimate 1-carboxyvinyltransferase [Planctomycetaceae bacterium]